MTHLALHDIERLERASLSTLGDPLDVPTLSCSCCGVGTLCPQTGITL